MAVQIFDVPGWSFSINEEKALKKLDSQREQALKQLPDQYKSRSILYLFDQIVKTSLYHSLKTLPKGVNHHLHFDCNEDERFYIQSILTDPIVYLDKDMNSFKLGTKQQALKKGWLSMKEVKQKFNTQQNFVKHVTNLTMLDKKQISQSQLVDQIWKIFEIKIFNFAPLLQSLHIFKKYVLYILRKYIKNGYDRIQFRSLLIKLHQYDENTGQLIKIHPQSKYIEAFDEMFEIVKKQHPILSVGFIFFGLKMITQQQNIKLLTTTFQQKWSKTIGIDFVQQEMDKSQEPYDLIANKVLAKFPQLKIKKVYHVGESSDHRNNNVEIAINAGCVRIGHGINILQHPQLIETCRKKGICFEKNPVSNIILGYVRDPRISTAQLLLGLGVPVTINPDDPGKFGLEDSTMDYFVTFISTNWNLRHLKLIGLHSINHAIVQEKHKKQLHDSFNKRWNTWIEDFLSISHNSSCGTFQSYRKQQHQNFNDK